MPIKRIFLLFFMVVICSGFVWEDCRRLGEAHVFGITTTTGMYISSTGECSALRSRAKLDDAREFISANQDSLKSEMAAGSGEHLDALTELFRCTRYRNDIYSQLQKHYPQVLGTNNEVSFDKVRSFYVRTCPSVLK